MLTRNLRHLAPMIAVISGVYLLFVRPWHLMWGATKEEAGRSLPGDALVPHPKLLSTRAVSIQAPAAAVWPWLMQLGVGPERGGFYSYDWLERLIGMDIRTADHVVPERPSLQVGDLVPLGPETNLMVAASEPNSLLVLHSRMHPLTGRDRSQSEAAHGAYIDWTWTWVLEALGEQSTRLILRTRGVYAPRSVLEPAMRLLPEPLHFVMERKMLAGIKARAEATAGQPSDTHRR
jgi:hypothetical protein